MTQDQNPQTINSNNDIIEQVSEEELQDITGGCLGCGVLGMVAAVDGANTLFDGAAFGSGSKIRKGVTQMAIGYESASHTSRQKTPCIHCITNSALYLSTKVDFPSNDLSKGSKG
jgi:hydroxyethylthiazole kinase-like sugar kinase family protein